MVALRLELPGALKMSLDVDGLLILVVPILPFIFLFILVLVLRYRCRKQVRHVAGMEPLFLAGAKDHVADQQLGRPVPAA